MKRIDIFNDRYEIDAAATTMLVILDYLCDSYESNNRKHVRLHNDMFIKRYIAYIELFINDIENPSIQTMKCERLKEIKDRIERLS